MILPTLNHEKRLWEQGFPHVVGVDEVGRGALAGPVVAAAVTFDQHHQPIIGVRDSKTLSRKQKQTLYDQILAGCFSYGIGQASTFEIDHLGIVTATALAMQRAIQEIQTVDHLLIDGRPFSDSNVQKYSTTFLIKGDAISYSIAAASIIAKVYRDGLMTSLDAVYKGYDFSRHVGYGTSSHINVIKALGLSPEHRKYFCRKLIDTVSEKSV